MTALLLVGTLTVVVLLLVVIFRLGTRLDGVRAEVERLRVVHRDMSSDVRTRLEEGARSWASLDTDLRPRLEQLEPAVADLGAALDENLPALSDARGRLEGVEQRVAAACERLDIALASDTQEQEQRFERIEEAVRTLRHAADERLADLGDRLRALEDMRESPRETSAGGVPRARSRGTGSAVGSSHPRRARGRWLLVMLLVALGVALALTVS